MASFDECSVWCMFGPLYLLFPLPGMFFLQISTSSPLHSFRSLFRYFLLSQVLPAYPTLDFNIQLIPLPCFIFLHSLFSHLRSCRFTYLSNVYLLSLQVKSIKVEPFVKYFITVTLNLEWYLECSIFSPSLSLSLVSIR